MFYIDLDIKTQDRYDMCKFMEMTDDGVFDSLNSYVLYQIPLLQEQGIYVVRKEAERPDLLSYLFYKDTQYWWVIMHYNGLLSPKDIKTGVKIRYPSLSDIEQVYMNATIYEKTIK